MERTGYVKFLPSWPFLCTLGGSEICLVHTGTYLLMGDKFPRETGSHGRQGSLSFGLAVVFSLQDILSYRYRLQSKYCFNLSHSGPAL